MKEEIKKQSIIYQGENEKHFGVTAKEIRYSGVDFQSGAEWMLEQYQGITPDTVKEMLEALKRIINCPFGTTYRINAYNNAKDVLNKAEKEIII